MLAFDYPILQLGIMLAEGAVIGTLAVYLLRATRKRADHDCVDLTDEFVSAVASAEFPRPPRTLRRRSALLRRLPQRSEEVIDVVPLNAA